MLDKHVHFLERTLVEQHGYALAGRVLALLVLLLDGFLAAAQTGLGTELYKLVNFFLLSTHFVLK